LVWFWLRKSDPCPSPQLTSKLSLKLIFVTVSPIIIASGHCSCMRAIGASRWSKFVWLNAMFFYPGALVNRRRSPADRGHGVLSACSQCRLLVLRRVLFCCVFSRPRSERWPLAMTCFLHVSLSSVILANSSTVSPVHGAPAENEFCAFRP